ncbi:hypothetical protein P0Q08_08400, partial [Campylobacter jejuni]|uniref:hypothetical protein n=1 Tax=Campylobacter jejuni TaxID=197 RepID=UPI002FBE626B
TYTIRVAAAGAEAGFEMVAADDPIDGPASAIRFRADYLLFEGTITAEYLDVDFLRGGRILTEYLDIETQLTILPGGALAYGKTSVQDEV